MRPATAAAIVVGFLSSLTVGGTLHGYRIDKAQDAEALQRESDRAAQIVLERALAAPWDRLESGAGTVTVGGVTYQTGLAVRWGDAPCGTEPDAWGRRWLIASAKAEGRGSSNVVATRTASPREAAPC